jgi:DNA-binding response OmpR family regulator
LPGNKVLVIDDDDVLLYLVQQILSQAGEQVFLADNGEEGLHQFLVHEPNLVILDIMMPGMDGWEVCDKIRQISSAPIMMLTALGHDSNIVRGLSVSGADDYLIKPFSSEVLVARVQALIRRAALSPAYPKPIVYEDNYLKIDLVSHQVLVQDQPVKLTITEYWLLAFLIQNANRVLSFEHILEEVWGAEYRDSIDYVQVYISRLRQKLELDPKNPHYFLTQHGIGYRFQKPAEFPTTKSF